MMKLFKITFAFLVGSQLLGCSEDPTATCIYTYTCENGATLESCGGESGGYYTINGVTVCYEYGTGTCADQAVQQCFPSLYTKGQGDVLRKLLETNLETVNIQRTIDQMYIDASTEVQTNP